MLSRIRSRRSNGSNGEADSDHPSAGTSGSGWLRRDNSSRSGDSRSRSAPRVGRRIMQFRHARSGGKPAPRRSTIFFDASQGLDGAQLVEEDEDLLKYQEKNGAASAKTKPTELSPENNDDIHAYPVITTNYVARETRKFSLDAPESMMALTPLVEEEGAAVKKTPPRFSFRRSKKQQPRRSSAIFREGLEHPRIKVVEQGYPGQLSAAELDQCLKFMRVLKNKNEQGDNTNIISEIVLSFKDIEDAPYAICRHMRTCKFDAQKQIDKFTDPNVVNVWKSGMASNFCPNLQEALGGKVTPGLLFSMLPMTFYGNAKNGCPVRYIKVGSFSPDGVLCMVTPQEGVNAWGWNQNAHVFPKSIKEAREANPDFVRCEAINVIDMNGLSRTQMSNDAIDILKQTTQVNQFFPETLHWTIILNAPGWFAFSWNLIKSMNFLPQRTANKVEVYSNQKKGTDRLLTMIDSASVPGDFGGKAPTLTEIVNGTGTQQERFESTEINVKKGKTASEDVAKLSSREKVNTITVFSRSIASAKIDVLFNGDKVKQDVSLVAPSQSTNVTGSNNSSDSSSIVEYAPYHIDIEGLGVGGPGTLSVEVTDLDSSVKDGNNKAPRGCYVVAAQILT